MFMMMNTRPSHMCCLKGNLCVLHIFIFMQINEDNVLDDDDDDDDDDDEQVAVTFGPMVTATASASTSTPCSIGRLASAPNRMSFA